MSDQHLGDDQDPPERAAVDGHVEREQADAAEHDEVGELELHPDRPPRVARARASRTPSAGRAPEHGAAYDLCLRAYPSASTAPATRVGAGRRRLGLPAVDRLPQQRVHRRAAGSRRGPAAAAPTRGRPRALDGLRSSRSTFAGIAVYGASLDGLRLERVVHRRGQRVEQAERLHPQDQLDRADHRQQVVAVAARPRRACAYGLITDAGMRWASTWSAPSCESSSTTKIADDDQIDECEIRSTICPSAVVVVGDHRLRRARAGLEHLGVVVGQHQVVEGRHRARSRAAR